MGGVMKKAKAKKAKKVKKAKVATKKAVAKKVVKRAVKKATAAIAAGCCTIIYDDKPSDQVEGVTSDACTRLGRARGGVGQWNPGSCA
jgi:hypothetical protein